MCGIAGYSLDADSGVDRTLAAQALLAGIAERGADAVGYAHRGIRARRHDPQAAIGRNGTSCRRRAPSERRSARSRSRLHKGPSQDLANNHPIRHGSVVGVHNGIIVNDEEIFARHGFERAEPEMTVDSEAIFALMDGRGRIRPPSRSSGARWRPPGSTSVPRAECTSPAVSLGHSGRPLAPGALLRLDEGGARGGRGSSEVTLRKREVAEGRCSGSSRAASSARTVSPGSLLP